MKKEFFSGKAVLVMGLGRFGGGADAARFAVKCGANVKITDLADAGQLKEPVKQLHDLPQIEYRLGSHQNSDFEWADIVIVNPAVRPENEFLEAARQQNKFITTAMNIFFELSPATVIGITGANGKSTTAALTAHILKSQAGQKNCCYGNVQLSGNIGNEPLLSVMGKITADDLVVLELSSFQTEALAQIKKGPHIGLLTNLTANHLDRHGTFDNYCDAKENIFKYQPLNNSRPAVSIFNAEDEIGTKWYSKYCKEAGRKCIQFSADGISEELKKQFALPGRANLSNLAAAVTIASLFGLDDSQISESVASFKGLAHRLELVAKIDGVSWYNDSIATTPQSTMAALQAFGQSKILIAGGYDKGLSFEQLGVKIATDVKVVILIGQTKEKIADAIRACPNSNTKIEFSENLSEAVGLAGKFAASGDVVLLSPACASYDMFDNFQQRGEQFARLVQQLI